MMVLGARRMPVPPDFKAGHLPAPTGGLNTVSPGTAMPPEDCFLLYNMIATEYGLRSRLGYREWCSSVTGAGDDYVRSLLPFTGSSSSGTNNRLFACSSSDIFDVTDSDPVPSSVFTFASASGRAGHGVCHTHVTSAGHFLLYCDEVNGYHTYKDAGASGGGADTWIAPAMGGGATDIDNVDPESLVFVTVFKGRVWFAERDTANLWYLDTGAVYGPATKFALGTKLKAGGSIRGIFNWTYDGGAGLDDSLVVVSDGGDVIVLQGTDPSDADLFGIRGSWSVGDLPAGREIAESIGGDLWILTRRGVLPMSQLVLGKPLDTNQYITSKISSLLNAAMLTKATVSGWAMRVHPEENALMLLVPEAEGTATTQLVMSMTTRGWGRYRDLPVYSYAVFGGKLYFGTVDGSVCINDGYVDGRPLSDPTEFTPVQFAGLSAFQNLGRPSYKQLGNLRPLFVGESASPSFSVEARYDFNQTELATVSLGAASGSLWDSALWDTALWGGDYSPSMSIRGTTGMGINVAIIWRGAAVDRTVLVGFDFTYREGGFL